MASTTKTKSVARVAAKPAAKKASADKTGAFAVIMTGGKQYIVRPGDVITVERMKGDFEAGKSHVFDQVLLTNDGNTTKVGTPTISGGKVTAAFVEEGRGKKLIVLKYKAKSRYRKMNGHRQPFMKFKIESIA